MEVFEAIKGRRSIRKYTKDPVSEDLIAKILEAGRWAPSAGNSQPWNFIVLMDGEVRRRVAEATTYGKFLANAPLGSLWLLILGRHHTWLRMGHSQPRTYFLLHRL